MKKGMLKRTTLLMMGTSLVIGNLAGCSAGATAYATGVAEYHAIADEIDVTGNVKGEEELTYYADVTAPISYLDLTVGDVVNAGDQLVAYDTSDLERSSAQARLTKDMGISNEKGQVQASNENQARYNKAANDEQIYMYLYNAVRMNSDQINQEQYQENWDIKCQYDSIQKSIADKYKKIQEKTNEQNSTNDEKRKKELANEIGELQIDVKRLEKDLATLPPQEMNPEEYAKSTYDANWMEDITRNWTQSTTVKNAYEAKILNKYQKEELEKNNELKELALEIAEDDLLKAQTGIFADFQGVVTDLQVKQGAVVSKGTPLFTIESNDSLKVAAQVSKYDIGKVKLGQNAVISIAGHDYAGSVSEIKQFAQSENGDKAKVTVYVHIDEPDENVYLGLEADVTILADEKEKALAVPIECLYTDDEGDYSYVIKNGVVEKCYFTAGIKTDTLVEVISGLNKEDVVITDAVTDEQIGKKAVAK